MTRIGKAELARRIRRARLARGMSQQQLANAVGVSRNAVQTWESGRTWPQNMVRLEQVLGELLIAEPVVVRPEERVVGEIRAIRRLLTQALARIDQLEAQQDRAKAVNDTYGPSDT